MSGSDFNIYNVLIDGKQTEVVLLTEAQAVAKQREYEGWADCCDAWMAPNLAKEEKELKHAELGL